VGGTGEVLNGKLMHVNSDDHDYLLRVLATTELEWVRLSGMSAGAI
jgi:hypothetical protein